MIGRVKVYPESETEREKRKRRLQKESSPEADLCMEVFEWVVQGGSALASVIVTL